jgi:hypothetical protein
MRNASRQYLPACVYAFLSSRLAVIFRKPGPSLKITFVILSLGSMMQLHSQDLIRIDLDQELKKNAVYGSVGLEFLSVSASVYAERIIGRGIESWGAETFVRIGIIGLAGASDGNVLAIDGGLLIPGISIWKFGLLEIAAGWHPRLNGDIGFPPIGGTVAFRYQKPQGHFLFRAGAGLPEILFVGVGFCF